MRVSTNWWWLQVSALRAQQALGWAGLAGLAMLSVSMVWFALAWSAHDQPLPDVKAPAPLAIEGPDRTNTTQLLNWPHRNEQALLLKLIQKIVVANGLPWSAAEYTVTAATETSPTTLEVRTSFKAPYPRLRATLTQLVRDVPGASIRELSMGRSTSDLPDVDAKLTMLVFLQDEATAARARP